MGDATATPGKGELHLAVDLGAGSGRAILGHVSPEGLTLEEVHRFHYPPALESGRLRWPFAAVLAGVREGLAAGRRAAERRRARVATVAVDSWGVDYGLLDAGGQLIEDPVCYRDHRTAGVMESVLREVPREEIFQRTGIQFLQFNTLFQLHAHVREGLPPGARRLLMIPDLCHHALCGAATGEHTNASTTQLLDVRTRAWADDLFSRLGLPRDLMPELVPAGTPLGPLRPALQKELGPGSTLVLAPATHDTASAVVGSPLLPGWAFVSSGTWSLVGVERRSPLVNDAAARANFTNEAGAAGTTRLLKNVMGLWILESCRHEWLERGLLADVETLVAAAAAIERSPGVLYPDHPRFFSPKSMNAEVQAALRETGQGVPEDPARITRVVLDSLAFRTASVVRTIEALTGQAIPGIHVVGGGCQNEYLDQAIADASGRPVKAGPAEATATGNVLLQAMSSGGLQSIEQGRALVERAVRPRLYEPRDRPAWRETAERYRDIEGRYA
jgi:rhamnulokinase